MKPDNNTVIYPDNKTYGEANLNYFEFLRTSYIDSQKSFESRLQWQEWISLNKN